MGTYRHLIASPPPRRRVIAFSTYFREAAQIITIFYLPPYCAAGRQPNVNHLRLTVVKGGSSAGGVAALRRPLPVGVIATRLRLAQLLVAEDEGAWRK